MSAKRKIVFVDRDGTLIVEPTDRQVDSFEKLRLVKDVVPALRKLVACGHELVMISNQDGLGTDSFPQAAFDGPQDLLLQILESQGIRFAGIHIDHHLPSELSDTRKPNIGMLLPYLTSGCLDMQRSCVIGDRDSDLQLARNLGLRGFKLDTNLDWSQIVETLTESPRRARVQRKTNETDIDIAVDLDRCDATCIDTGIGFFDHMLEQLVKHGGFSAELKCIGDLQIDAHHTIEDVALALGNAIDQALGDRLGIGRYGFLLPMDESLANVAIDLSGRPAYVQRAAFTVPSVGDFPTEMVQHFFGSLAQSLRAAIHIDVRGENNHHMVEAMFKGCGRALRPALLRSGNELPSTKGVL